MMEMIASTSRRLSLRTHLVVSFGILALLFGNASLAWADLVQNAPSRYVDEAKNYLAKGQLREAEIQLKNALRDNPKDLDARIALGIVAMRKGDAGGAERSFKLALAQNGPRQKVLPLLGQSYLMQGKAREILDELTTDDLLPKMAAQIANLRAQAYMLQKHTNEAKKEAETALALQPEMPEALLTLAVLHRHNGDIAGAESLVDRALAVAPTDTLALDAKGDLRALQGDMVSALEAFKKSLAERPDGVNAKLGTAAALVALGENERARTEVDELLKRRPGQPAALYLRALILDRDGRDADALAALEPAAPSLNDFLAAQIMLGKLNLRAGRNDKAQFHAQRASSLAPTEIGPKLLLGLIYSRKEQPLKVVELLEPAAAIAPDNASIALILGNAYGRLGRFDAAAKALEIALRRDPNNSEIRTRLAASRLGAGDREAGSKELLSLLQADPKAREASVLLISSMMDSGRLSEAEKIGFDLRVSQPDNPLIDNLLGRIHWMRGDWDAAIKDFESALRKLPTFLDAAKSLVFLRQVKGEPDGAESLYAGILKADPKNAQAMVALAVAAQTRGDEESAANWLEKAAASADDSADISVQLIELLMMQKKIQKALAIAQALDRKAHDVPKVVNVLARAQWAAGQPESTVISLRHLAALQSNAALGQFKLGETLMSLDRPEDALGAYRQAIESDPGYLPAWQALVAVTARTEGLDKSAEIIKQALAHRVVAPYADVLQGEAYLSAGRHADAQGAFRAAFNRAPDVRVMMRLAETHAHAGDKQGMIAIFADWLKSHPDDVSVRGAYADALMENNENNAATREYSALLDANPINVAALNNLAWLRSRTDTTKALEHANLAFGLAPQSPQVRDTLAWILFQRGDIGPAKSLLRMAHAQAPEDPEIGYHLAMVLARAGDTKGARVLLGPLVQTSVAFASKDDAQQLLYKLGTTE